MRRVLVTDASVVVDLLGRFAAEPIEAALFEDGGELVEHVCSMTFERYPFGGFDTPRYGKTPGSYGGI